jgi:predicted adenine nucleotide alpha hydrolase (AANH) superfamily ATPase
MPEPILLHTCCAPCSVAVIDELRAARPVTVLFYNPNIHPEAEYLKRKAEVVRMCQLWNIPMVDLDYEPDVWEQNCGGLPPQREGGPRCSACFRLRLARTARYAKEQGFTDFATSLTMGRRKNSAVINAIGQSVALQQGLSFLGTDWKKGGRYEKGTALVAQHQIYKQDYCGCRVSLAERNARLSAD